MLLKQLNIAKNHELTECSRFISSERIASAVIFRTFSILSAGNKTSFKNSLDTAIASSDSSAFIYNKNKQIKTIN